MNITTIQNIASTKISSDFFTLFKNFRIIDVLAEVHQIINAIMLNISNFIISIIRNERSNTRYLCQSINKNINGCYQHQSNILEAENIRSNLLKKVALN